MNLPIPPDGPLPRYAGVHPAVVTDPVDPESLGRVEVRFPWLRDDDPDVRAWATLCSPCTDGNQASVVLPAVGSQVVVAFEDGDVSRPVVLGAVWQGSARPESPSDDGHPRVLGTRSGSRLVLDDSAGTAGVRTASGHEVVLDDTAEQVTVAHASGCRVTLSATSVTIQASVSVDVIAPTVTVDASLARFSGVLQADTVVATTAVVSPSYSPGAGNLL